MPLLHKLLSSIKSSKNNSECRLLLDVDSGGNDRSGSYFGADQVRILLFRECEWRGRKLLFDSVSEKNTCNVSSASKDASQNVPKQGNGSFTRNGAGLVSEHEKVACDDVSLLSEMVFGTVAMTYRGPLFKVHALNAPKCIMCTKVFPATDHNAHRTSDRLSDDNLGHSLKFDSTSSVGSIKNTISHLSSGHFSGNSLSPDLRKNSTCSSNSSGWDIDIPLLSSSQSLESNGSSGFGSLTSLRRRWLRAVSTTLSHSELDEIFGIHAYSENIGSDGINHRRHKTRLGLAVLIQLTPGHERQMETLLFEHAAQLEGMLNRLCYACIESCRTHGKSTGEFKSLTLRMRRASTKCIAWLLRLLATVDSPTIPSLWHEVIMNSTTPIVQRKHSLHRNLQQMCQLLNSIDTKSTNFFLSTVVTAVLTYHLGWVQTVMSLRDKHLMENLGKRYPCNPLWTQLGDLYGALGNPPKMVHTIIAGDPEKTALINCILSFLSYFIRSAIVEKRRESRCPSQKDVQEAIDILEQINKKNDSILKLRSMNSIKENLGASSECSREKLSSNVLNDTPKNLIKSKIDCAKPSTINHSKITPDDSNIPRIKRTRSTQKNLDTQSEISSKLQFKYPMKFESCNDDEINAAAPATIIFEEKECPTSTVKIIVSETTNSPTDASRTKKRFPRNSPVFNLEQKMDIQDSELEELSSTVKIIVSETTNPSADAGGPKQHFSRSSSIFNLEHRIDFQDSEVEELTMNPKLTTLRKRTDSGFDSQKFRPSESEETEAFYARLDLPKDGQQSQVFFTLGEDEKMLEQQSRIALDCGCQYSFAFTHVPSTSAKLPEEVLRKIIQRNFPESSKSVERPDDSSLKNERFSGSCPKCNGAGYSAPQTFEERKLILETPTNATELLRNCANSVDNRTTRLLRPNSLEALMEASEVIELPMPRSKKVLSSKEEANEVSGFTKTLLQRRVVTNTGRKFVDPTIYDSGYTSGLVIQGLTKKKRKMEQSPRETNGNEEIDNEKDWLSKLRGEVNVNARFPVIDQPVSEALCIIADLDNWQVGILSNNSPAQNPMLPVGMSRLVATMLESFTYLWTKYRSPTYCIGIFECKLREMWLRSEALAEMLLAVDVCDVTIASLTKALDLDAADIPLLLAVASTHSPQIAQRFGLSLA